MATRASWRDWGLLLLCNLIWGGQFVFVKIVQRQMGPLFATFFPLALSVLLALPLANRDRRRTGTQESAGRIPARDWLGFVLLGAFGQFLVLLFSTWGIRLTLASNAALLGLSLPVVIAVLAYFLLAERMTVIRAISFALAMAGVVECSGLDLRGFNFGNSKFLAGNLMCLVSVLGSAFYNTYSKKLLGRYSALRVVAYTYAIAALMLLPITLYFERDSFRNLLHFSLLVWTGMIFLAFVRNILAQVLFLRVLSRIDATMAGLTTYLIPFFGVTTAAIFLHERMTRYMVLGGMLVLVSSLLTTVYEERQRRRALPRPVEVKAQAHAVLGPERASKDGDS